MRETADVVFEKIGCIAVIRINNPPQNYLSSPAFISMEKLNRSEEDHDIKGIIITGTGRHFSAGADMDKLFDYARSAEILKKEMTAGLELLEHIYGLRIPVVAAINGACLGGGLEIAMACHIRFASAKSIFAFPEINHGLMPGLGGMARMVKQSGNHHAISLLLSGDIIDAEKALKYNILHYISDENVLESSLKYLENMVGTKPKKVISLVMQAIHNANKLPLHEALHEETRMFCELALDEAARRKSEL